MVAFPTYSIGTVSIADGSTTLAGDGAIWSGVNARSGDTIFVDGVQNKISDVTDDTHLELVLPQSGAKSGVSYVIIQDSPLRFVGGQAMADVSSLIKVLNDKGLLWYLPDGYTTPDGGIGLPALTADDGQGILKIDTGALWVMTGGSWVSAGTYKGFQFRGAYDSGTSYNVNDVVTSAGNAYVVTAATTGNAPPNASYYSLLASKGDQGDKGDTGPVSLKPIEPWATATAYVVGPPASFVSQGGSAYECLVPHTSGASFSTDLAAGKWGVVASKGTDGAGVGDVQGGSTSTDGGLVVYDGTDGKHIKPLDDAAAARVAVGIPAVLRGYISGISISKDAVTATTLNYAEGVATDDTNTATIITAGGSIDITAVGVVDGIQATRAANTWYHAFIISKANGTTGGVVSISATAPTLPTGYIYKKRIGSFKTDASYNITDFTQSGNEFLWKTQVVDLASTTAPGTTAQLYTLSVPTGVQVDAIINALSNYVTSGNFLVITSPDQTDTAAGVSNYTFVVNSTLSSRVMELRRRTNTSAQIRVRADGSTQQIGIITIGWVDKL